MQKIHFTKTNKKSQTKKNYSHTKRMSDNLEKKMTRHQTRQIDSYS